MCATKTDIKPSLVMSVLQSRCPRCRRGKIYKHDGSYHLKGLMQMNDNCPVCGQSFQMEVGFYYGTGYVSYALAVAVCVATFIAWWVILGFSLKDNRFFWWLSVNALILILLQPPIMRISRVIWLAFFVHYSSDWAKGDVVHTERVNKEQMNNW